MQQPPVMQPSTDGDYACKFCCCWCWIPAGNRPVQTQSVAPQTKAACDTKVKVPKLPLQQQEGESDPSSLKLHFETPRSDAEPTPEEALDMYKAAQVHCKGGPQHSALKHNFSHQSTGVSNFSTPDNCDDEVHAMVSEHVRFGGGGAGNIEGKVIRRSTGDNTGPGFRRTDSHNRRVSFNDDGQDSPPHLHHMDSKKRALSNEVSMKKIVDMLYKRVLDDPQLAPFFRNIPMQRLKKMQTSTMLMAFGGEALTSGNGPDMRQVHLHLIRDEGLSLRHWDLWVKHFQDTLNELPEIPEEQKEAALRSIRATKHYFRPIHSGETPRASVDVNE